MGYHIPETFVGVPGPLVVFGQPQVVLIAEQEQILRYDHRAGVGAGMVRRRGRRLRRRGGGGAAANRGGSSVRRRHECTPKFSEIRRERKKIANFFSFVTLRRDVGTGVGHDPCCHRNGSNSDGSGAKPVTVIPPLW